MIKRVSKLALPMLVVAIGALSLGAGSASATVRCSATGSPTTCNIDLISNGTTPPSAGVTNTTFTVAGGLGVLSCNQSTIRSTGTRDGDSSISTTGASVRFFDRCRLNIDAGCTVIVTPAAADAWTLSLTNPSGPGPNSWDLSATIGRVTIELRTCNIASNNGTLTVAIQGLAAGCLRYTNPTGILTVTCDVRYTTAGNIRTLLGAGGVARFVGSYHATNNAGGSPVVQR